MHRFFELISVGEEIIQEGARFDAFKAKGRAGGAAALAGAKKAGGFLKNKGKAGGTAAFEGIKKSGRFVKANPKKFALAAGVGAGGAFAAHKFMKRQESNISRANIEEGLGSTLAGYGTRALGFGKKYGTQALGFAKRSGSEMGNIGRSTKNIFSGTGTLGGRGRQFGRALRANKIGAGTLAMGTGGVGYGGYRMARRNESALPELSANLQEAFLKGLFKKKNALQRGGEAVVGAAKKAGGSITRSAGIVKDAATSGYKYAKNNPVKTGLGVLGTGGAVGGGIYAKKKYRSK